LKRLKEASTELIEDNLKVGTTDIKQKVLYHEKWLMLMQSQEFHNKKLDGSRD